MRPETEEQVKKILKEGERVNCKKQQKTESPVPGENIWFPMNWLIIQDYSNYSKQAPWFLLLTPTQEISNLSAWANRQACLTQEPRNISYQPLVSVLLNPEKCLKMAFFTLRAPAGLTRKPSLPMPAHRELLRCSAQFPIRVYPEHTLWPLANSH